MREKELEAYLRREIEKLGGRFPKWVSPGNRGVPDRIALFSYKLKPGWTCDPHHSEVWFVELKAPGGKLRPEQKRWRDWLTEKNAFDYVVISSKEEADEWLNTIRQSLGKN